jgi:hypothetical protein
VAHVEHVLTRLKPRKRYIRVFEAQHSTAHHPLLVLLPVPTMLLTSLLALAPLLGLVLGAESPINHLAGLAAATSDGVIRLDPKTFEILTALSRNWSTTIHFTALDPKRKCTPCRCVGLPKMAVAVERDVVEAGH